MLKAVNAFFWFTTAQAASFPGKYTIVQPRLQTNLPSNEWYIPDLHNSLRHTQPHSIDVNG